MLTKDTNHFWDLSFRAGRRRQSGYTGFVHLFEGKEALDTIPVYENFCFALALLRQKTAESIAEGKNLILKLLPFQSVDGNFPIYLHQYPNCYDPHMGLKVAPILIYSLKQFGPVLGPDLKDSMELSLQKALQNQPESPLWKARYRVCRGEDFTELNTSEFSPEDWENWVITNQLSGKMDFDLPVDSISFRFMPTLEHEAQEGSEPKPNLLDWLISEKRIENDHPKMIQLAAFSPISYTPYELRDESIRHFWNGKMLHSLVGAHRVFHLSGEIEWGRKDLFEVALYCNISEETEIFVEGQKGTFFGLGDIITVRTPQKSFEIRFECIEGEGDFTGHIFPSNRPCQLLKGYAAYDWKIGLRTLRRSSEVKIRALVTTLP